MRAEFGLLIAAILFFCCWCAYIISKMNSSVTVSPTMSDGLSTQGQYMSSLLSQQPQLQPTNQTQRYQSSYLPTVSRHQQATSYTTPASSEYERQVNLKGPTRYLQPLGRYFAPIRAQEVKHNDHLSSPSSELFSSSRVPLTFYRRPTSLDYSSVSPALAQPTTSFQGRRPQMEQHYPFARGRWQSSVLADSLPRVGQLESSSSAKQKPDLISEEDSEAENGTENETETETEEPEFGKSSGSENDDDNGNINDADEQQQQQQQQPVEEQIDRSSHSHQDQILLQEPLRKLSLAEGVKSKLKQLPHDSRQAARTGLTIGGGNLINTDRLRQPDPKGVHLAESREINLQDLERENNSELGSKSRATEIEQSRANNSAKKARFGSTIDRSPMSLNVTPAEVLGKLEKSTREGVSGVAKKEKEKEGEREKGESHNHSLSESLRAQHWDDDATSLPRVEDSQEIEPAAGSSNQESSDSDSDSSSSPAEPDEEEAEAESEPQQVGPDQFMHSTDRRRRKRQVLTNSTGVIVENLTASSLPLKGNISEPFIGTLLVGNLSSDSSLDKNTKDSGKTFSLTKSTDENNNSEHLNVNESAKGNNTLTNRIDSQAGASSEPEITVKYRPVSGHYSPSPESQPPVPTPIQFDDQNQALIEGHNESLVEPEHALVEQPLSELPALIYQSSPVIVDEPRAPPMLPAFQFSDQPQTSGSGSERKVYKKKKKKKKKKKMSKAVSHKSKAASLKKMKKKSKSAKGSKYMKGKKAKREHSDRYKEFKGSKRGSKKARGSKNLGANKGSVYYNDKGYKKRGFKKHYEKQESGEHKTYFDAFRDKDHKKRWSKFGDKNNYSKSKHWSGKERKKYKNFKLDEMKNKKLGKWRDNSSSKIKKAYKSSSDKSVGKKKKKLQKKLKESSEKSKER